MEILKLSPETHLHVRLASWLGLDAKNVTWNNLLAHIAGQLDVQICYLRCSTGFI